jgi:hypothetical protein
MISLLPGSSSSFTSLSSSNNANNALFKRRQQQQQQQQQQRNGRMIKAVSFLRSHYFFTTNTNENASNNNNNNNNNNNDNNNNRRRKKRRDALLKVVRATKEDKKSSTAKEVDEITKKWGLEAGLWKIFKSSEKNNSSTNNNKTGGEGAQQLSGSRMNMAKQLLKTYGSAYLITSISLSLVSFGVFYVLVSSGVDVAALLSVIGITATQNSEKVGTVAIAYAAHKAASPIRFPPTVALTPIVAGWMGKTGNKGEEEEEVGEGGEEK